MDIFNRFFAGISMEEIDTFPLLPLGCWLLPIGVWLLAVGFCLGMDRKNRRFAVIRYGGMQKWWKHYFFKNMIYGGLAAGMLPLAGWLAELLVLRHLRGSIPETAEVFALWIVHGMALLALYLFLDTTRIKRIIPAMLLILEVMTFLYGYRNKKAAPFMFGIWGMYRQSSFYDRIGGFPVLCMVALQIAIIAGCYLLGIYCLKRKEAEGVQ